MDNRDWNEPFRIINKDMSSKNNIDYLPDNKLNYDLDEMEPIGDSFHSAAISYDAPNNLKKNIIAVLKAQSLGLSSIDYVIKKYGNLWKFPLLNEEQIAFYRLLRQIKNEVESVINQLDYIPLRKGLLGIQYAGTSLIRLKSSFRSVTLLISKRYPIESLAICRLILEQCAWAYSIYNLKDSKQIHHLKPNKTISLLKRIFPDIGKFYGWLNIITHLDSEYDHQYYGLTLDDNIIVKFDIPELTNIVLHCLLKLVDIFRVVSEFIFYPFLEKRQAWQKTDKGNLVLCENRPLSEEIKNLTKKILEQK